MFLMIRSFSCVHPYMYISHCIHISILYIYIHITFALPILLLHPPNVQRMLCGYIGVSCIQVHFLVEGWVMSMSKLLLFSNNNWEGVCLAATGFLSKRPSMLAADPFRLHCVSAVLAMSYWSRQCRKRHATK